jgi:hypothetical protein
MAGEVTMDTPNPAEIEPQDQSRSLEPRVCARCGTALSGRQTRFCSQACNTAYWDERHPRIGRPAAPGAPGTGSIRQRVFDLMTDGAWRTVLEIAQALGIQPQTASAKLRDLRKARYGSFVVDRRAGERAYTRQAYEYRLVLRAFFLACVCNFHILFDSVKEIVHTGVKFL